MDRITNTDTLSKTRFSAYGIQAEWQLPAELDYLTIFTKGRKYSWSYDTLSTDTISYVAGLDLKIGSDDGDSIHACLNSNGEGSFRLDYNKYSLELAREVTYPLEAAWNMNMNLNPLVGEAENLYQVKAGYHYADSIWQLGVEGWYWYRKDFLIPGYDGMTKHFTWQQMDECSTIGGSISFNGHPWEVIEILARASINKSLDDKVLPAIYPSIVVDGAILLYYDFFNDHMDTELGFWLHSEHNRYDWDGYLMDDFMQLNANLRLGIAIGEISITVTNLMDTTDELIPGFVNSPRDWTFSFSSHLWD
jgi:hypothetical protein